MSPASDQQFRQRPAFFNGIGTGTSKSFDTSPPGIGLPGNLRIRLGSPSAHISSSFRRRLPRSSDRSPFGDVSILNGNESHTVGDSTSAGIQILDQRFHLCYDQQLSTARQSHFQQRGVFHIHVKQVCNAPADQVPRLGIRLRRLAAEFRGRQFRNLPDDLPDLPAQRVVRPAHCDARAIRPVTAATDCVRCTSCSRLRIRPSASFSTCCSASCT